MVGLIRSTSTLPEPRTIFVAADVDSDSCDPVSAVKISVAYHLWTQILSSFTTGRSLL